MKVKDICNYYVCREDTETHERFFYGWYSQESADGFIKRCREHEENKNGMCKPKFIFYRIDGEDEINE